MEGLNVTIDISKWQKNVDYTRVKADGISGVIVKATEGMNYVDPMWSKHRAGVLRSGMKLGAYHFGTGSNPVGQAEDFLEAVDPGPDTLLALDFERNPHGTQMTLGGARKFVRHIEAKTGRFPVFYCGSFFAELMGNRSDPVFAQCPLWIAAYIRQPRIQRTWTEYTFWQYTDGQSGPQPRRVDGVGGCDRNTFSGSRNEYNSFWKSGL